MVGLPKAWEKPWQNQNARAIGEICDWVEAAGLGPVVQDASRRAMHRTQVGHVREPESGLECGFHAKTVDAGTTHAERTRVRALGRDGVLKELRRHGDGALRKGKPALE